ncbi:MAG: glycosyl hydrolase family 18 protein [Limnochordia bacterium]|jgi:spore germination protein|nr:glycosyl hydrolase family 18 protein [Bacillota bacterium]NLL08455.1 SH3 domain-containing protein [Bacillota bacterium]
MARGVIVTLLSILFYFTTLLGGQAPHPVEPMAPPAQQRTYEVLGQTALLAADAVTVRSGPSAEADALGVIKKDTARVIILDHQAGWYKVHLSSGLSGWVPEHALTIVPSVPKPLDRLIVGYFEPGEAAYDTLLAHSTKLTATAPLGWSLDSYGGITADFDPQEMGRSLYFAGNQELLTFAHVRVPASPTRLLSSAYLQQQAISQLVNVVAEWGLKGLIIHFDYVPEGEQYELFSFLQGLQAELAAKGGRTLVSFPWDENLDYAAASRAADYVVLQGSRDTKEPGPLAALVELDQMLAAITKTVDARKIILALSTSGLDWPRTGGAQVLSHEQVMDLAARQGAKIRWDSVSMTPYFHYGNGHEVWFENRYSMKYKLELVAKYNLAGAALGNLGQEDPEIWDSAAELLIG